MNLGASKTLFYMLTRTTCYCNVAENKIKQYFAAQIVQYCQQYCSPLLHLIQAQQYFTYTRKNAQVVTSLQTSCNKSVYKLLTSCVRTACS